MAGCEEDDTASLMLDPGYWMLDAGQSEMEIPYYRLKGDDRKYWNLDLGIGTWEF